MITKEQIAHDLTMVYLNNKYGVHVEGNFGVTSNSLGKSNVGFSGLGSVDTTHLPNVDEPRYIKVGTGNKGLLGLEKKQKVQSGYLVDNIFANMIKDYYKAYVHFLEMLENK